MSFLTPGTPWCLPTVHVDGGRARHAVTADLFAFCRVYKNFDPRAKIIREVAEEVFQIQGRDPLIDVAVELEKRARSDDYFVSRNLYPNVDFYSGAGGTSYCRSANLYSVKYMFCSHLGLIRRLSLIATLSTQQRIPMFTEKLGDINKITLSK